MNGSLVSNPARSISLARPETVNGAPRSEVKMKGDWPLFFFRVRRALSSSPSRGVCTGYPALGSAEMQGAGLKLNIGPLKPAQFRSP